MAETKTQSPRTVKATAAGKSTTEKRVAVKRTVTAAGKSSASAAAKPSTKTVKAAPSSRSRAQTTAKKTALKTKSKKGNGNGDVSITPEQRYRMICDAAYYRAQRRGFVGGNPAEDWFAAETEVDELIHSMRH